jgi:hypothetical protein
MAQHDYIIANQSGAAFRSDLNNGLAAIVSQNSGAAQPSTTYAYQWWADTTTGLLKIRNAANNAWITLFQLDGEWTTLALENGTAAAPSLYFKDSGTDTGIFSPGADQLGIATNGVERVEFGTTEVVFNDGGADVDFRVEGDTNADLFKVDAGADTVIIDGLTHPSADGSADQALVTNGSGVLSFASRSRLVLGTSVASTSGTSIDFTSIPSWVKRVTVMFNGVSLSGSSNILVQIGSGSVTTTGYSSFGAVAGSSNIALGVSSVIGFIAALGAAGNFLMGSCVITLQTGTTYTAAIAGGVNQGGTDFYSFAGGGSSSALSGVLDRVRITTVNGADTFDNGTINILYEG